MRSPATTSEARAVTGVTSPSGINWEAGENYEPFMGRWSRLLARTFCLWLVAPADLDWIDVGCGTGALSQAILDTSRPRQVVGVDPSVGFVTYARARISGGRTHFLVADARAIPLATTCADAVAAGLVLNFVPRPSDAVAEMKRLTRAGGIVAAYVWDYSGQMDLLNTFWDAATALEPAAVAFREHNRSPLAGSESLTALFADVGLTAITVQPLEVTMDFRDFDDYWRPFLGGQGPAPSYVSSLDVTRRAALKAYLRSSLPINADGSIRLHARAWAVRGQKT